MVRHFWRGLLGLTLRKMSNNFHSLIYFPFLNFLYFLYFFLFIFVLYLGGWEQGEGRDGDGGYLMEKFTSGTIVIDLYFCIFKVTALHSAICAFDFVNWWTIISFYGAGHLATSNLSIWHQTEGTKKKKMYYQKQKIIFSDTNLYTFSCFFMLLFLFGALLFFSVVFVSSHNK